MSWVYRRPSKDWYYSRDRLIPLGAPNLVNIVPEAGVGIFSGRAPRVQTGFKSGIVQIPIEASKTNVSRKDGVYRSTSYLYKRAPIIQEGGPAAGGDVILTAEVGEADFTGNPPTIPGQVLSVPLSIIDFTGLAANILGQVGAPREADTSFIFLVEIEALKT